MYNRRVRALRAGLTAKLALLLPLGIAGCQCEPPAVAHDDAASTDDAHTGPVDAGTDAGQSDARQNDAGRDDARRADGAGSVDRDLASDAAVADIARDAAVPDTMTVADVARPDASSDLGLLITNYRGHVDPEPADWVGVRFDDGTWQQVDPGDGRSSVALQGGESAFTVAVVCNSSSNVEVYLFSALLAETRAVINTCRAPAGGWYGSFQQRFSYLNWGDNVYPRSAIGVGEGNVWVFPGRYDVVHIAGVEGYGEYPPPPYHAVIQRAYTVSATDTPTVDFNSGASTSTFHVDARGYPHGADVYFVTTGGTFTPITPFSMDYGSPVPCARIPAVLRQAGDMHLVHVPYLDQETFLFLADPHDVSFDFTMPALDTPTVGHVGDPWSGRLTVAWTATPNTKGVVFAARNDPYGDATPEWSAFVSAGWLQEATTYTLPDLSSAPGFDSRWNLLAEYMQWSLGAVMTQGSVAQLIGSALTVPARPAEYQNYHRVRSGPDIDGLRLDISTRRGYQSP